MENNHLRVSGKYVSFIETFFNFQDACNWVEHHLEEFKKEDGWFQEQTSINLINGAYRAGVVFSKSQKELDFDFIDYNKIVEK